VEMLNLRLRRVVEAPVNLRDAYAQAAEAGVSIMPVSKAPAKISPKKKPGKKRK